MTFAKAFLILLAALGLIGLGLWQFVLKDQVAFGQVASAYAAKQICSCRFISERPLEACKQDFTQDISQLDISVVTENIDGQVARQSVVASALGIISAEAVHRPDFGCVLEP